MTCFGYGWETMIYVDGGEEDSSLNYSVVEPTDGRPTAVTLRELKDDALATFVRLGGDLDDARVVVNVHPVRPLEPMPVTVR